MRGLGGLRHGPSLAGGHRPLRASRDRQLREQQRIGANPSMNGNGDDASSSGGGDGSSSSSGSGGTGDGSTCRAAAAGRRQQQRQRHGRGSSEARRHDGSQRRRPADAQARQPRRVLRRQRVHRDRVDGHDAHLDTTFDGPWRDTTGSVKRPLRVAHLRLRRRGPQGHVLCRDREQQRLRARRDHRQAVDPRQERGHAGPEHRRRLRQHQPDGCHGHARDRSRRRASSSSLRHRRRQQQRQDAHDPRLVDRRPSPKSEPRRLDAHRPGARTLRAPDSERTQRRAHRRMALRTSTYGGHYGDCGPYHGWIVGIPARATPAGASMAKSYAIPANEAGMWAPGGPSSDGTSIFMATGNGTTDSPASSMEGRLLDPGSGPVRSSRRSHELLARNGRDTPATKTSVARRPSWSMRRQSCPRSSSCSSARTATHTR